MQRLALPLRRSLLVLAVAGLFLASGCRAVRARKLEDRLDHLENRVTALETQVQELKQQK